MFLEIMTTYVTQGQISGFFHLVLFAVGYIDQRRKHAQQSIGTYVLHFEKDVGKLVVMRARAG